MKTTKNLVIGCVVLCLSVIRASGIAAAPAGDDRPNIVWITCEDIGPDLGCYGDTYADTPNIDGLAARSLRFTNAFATAPICSPARSALISGVWPNAKGTVHLRTRDVRVPDFVREYPRHLRDAGYWCTNRGKQDYNYDFRDRDIWDVHDPSQESTQAHWRSRPSEETPFFAVFNLEQTHQSRIRMETPRIDLERRHDPAKAPVPPYYPDTPAIRDDIARYYDTVTLMDDAVGEILAELREDGLMDETIVFFYSDHGRGMPRHKRYLYDAGMRVPLLVYIPEKYRHLAPEGPGSRIDGLVSFIDFPPTLLRLAGVDVPDVMDGRVFLERGQEEEGRRYVFGSRDRIDEVLEVVRSARDDRYLYIRNYLPHRPRMPYSHYSEQADSRKELRRMAASGDLIGSAREFMLPTKPVEELYDTKADPHQVYNLAAKPEYRQILERLRGAYRDWSRSVRDVALVPEPMMLRLAQEPGLTVYEWSRSPEHYDHDAVLAAAEMVGRDPDPELVAGRLRSEDPAVRYWAAVTALAMGESARQIETELFQALADPAPMVRLPAAEALAGLGHADRARETLTEVFRHEDGWLRLYAGMSMRYLGREAAPALPAIRRLGREKTGLAHVDKYYLPWLVEDTVGWLESGSPPLFDFAEEAPPP